MGHKKDEKKKKKKGGRRLVLCFDGTGNRFNADESDTNVMKIYEMLDRQTDRQYEYYQLVAGIGTFTTGSSGSALGFFGRMKEKFETILDQAIGTTFQYHVCKGYEFIMRYYKPGDYIYFFGFSRGAYTARFLSEMIDVVGVLSKGNEEMIRFAYATFAEYIKASGREPTADDLKKKSYRDSFKNTFCRPDIKVYFLGIFDCVNSVGQFEVPFRRAPYHFTSTPSAVHIRHAVSIHERRLKFKPKLCLYKDSSDTVDLKEVWFAGNHCDVGGGEKYEHGQQEHLLSDTPLAWMIDEILALDDDPDAKLCLDMSSIANSGHLHAGHERLMQLHRNPEKCHHEVVNARRPHDYLTYGRGEGWLMTTLWWVIEILPLFTRLELEHGRWIPRYWPPNLGASRDLPDDAVVHPSVQAMHHANDPLRVARSLLPWNLKKPASIDLLGTSVGTKVRESRGAHQWAWGE
ncbi:hypothetical protein BDV25DRAFT_128857 [Aspergillus avenaceus]|uniref:T6SS Phospholipase effector Tle1-like catalytic domain-containing protein n=1 Tax=Aspergillus avenaceus TaxID=36643 RepID=A0A5N6TYK1_ASPAV|nr:hypothetical protein BDV25DRAFT_128857 [Aspergillus avenaceus]